MVVRELLDETSAVEQVFVGALKLLPFAAKREELQRKLESGLKRISRMHTRIRACCQTEGVSQLRLAA